MEYLCQCNVRKNYCVVHLHHLRYVSVNNLLSGIIKRPSESSSFSVPFSPSIIKSADTGSALELTKSPAKILGNKILNSVSNHRSSISQYWGSPVSNNQFNVDPSSLDSKVNKKIVLSFKNYGHSKFPKNRLVTKRTSGSKLGNIIRQTDESFTSIFGNISEISNITRNKSQVKFNALDKAMSVKSAGTCLFLNNVV